MKLIIDPKPLASAVSAVTRSLPVRPPVPILAGAMLTADDGGILTVSGFDYETSTAVQTPVTVLEAGRALVSGRLLGDIAKACPNKAVELITDATTATIRCGSARFTLPLLPVEDYPALPTMPARIGSVDGPTWCRAVGQAAHAAGRDDSLPMLTGVRVEIDGSRITLAGTDRFRLAVAELDWAPDDPGVSCALLVPASTLTDMAKTLSASATIDVLHAAGTAMVGFAADGHETTTRLLDAEFPRFRQLIPAEHTTTATVATADLVATVKRVALVTDRVAQVRLAFTEDRVTVSAGGQDSVGDAEEHLDAQVTGDPVTIAFNPTYLLDALNALDTPRVTWSFTTPNRPAVLRPALEVSADPDDSEVGPLVLLMPVRLPS